MLCRYNEERKAREEIDSEVLSLNRKIKLMEDNIKRKEDRWAAAEHRTKVPEDEAKVFTITEKAPPRALKQY